MKNKLAFLYLILLLLITAGCARNNPSEVAMNRWRDCSIQIANLDSTLIVSDIILPDNFSQIVISRDGLNPIKSLESLYDKLTRYDESCKPIGVRIYNDFRVYPLAQFTRRLTEYSTTLEAIKEQHLLIIGDLKQVKDEQLGLLNHSTRIYSKLLNDSTHYMVFQNR